MNPEIMKQAGFAKEVALVDKGLCPTCTKPVGTFRDSLSYKEFGISGMCQACQDEIFGDEEETMKVETPEYTDVFTYEKSLQAALDNNLDVILPEPNQLFIDIDTEKDYEEYRFNMELIEIHLPYLIDDVEERPSKSGLPGRHVTLTLERDVTDLERIGLQAILGSDRKREMLSWLSAGQGHQHPTLFFEKKQDQLQAAPELLQISGGNFLTDSDIPY